MPPSTRIKRSASPSPTHPKRIKKDSSSSFPRTSKIGPIFIDDDSSSDSDNPNDQLSSLRQEVQDINAMIKEAEKRHKVKHGERELAEQELVTKHHFEEHAEQEEMLRLQNLQKKAGDRLRRQMRDTIHALRFRPSKISADISVHNERNISPRSSPPAIRKKKSRTKGSSVVPRIQMPVYILSLNNDYHHKLPLPDTSIKFSRRFLSRFIGGGEQMTRVNISDAKRKTQIYPVDRYAGFHTDWNPQAPQSAGMHGAGLSIGCVDTKSGKPVGVDEDTCSISRESSLQEQTHYFVYRRAAEWEYCGLYVQGRKFEKLTLDEYKLHVSESVRDLWAEKTCLKDWGHDVLVQCGAAKTKEDAMRITPDQVRGFMDCPDDKPGIKLRFYWLYMECVDYDLDFYQALAKKGLQVGWTTREDPDKPNRYGLNADMPTAVLEDQEDGQVYKHERSNTVLT